MLCFSPCPLLRLESNYQLVLGRAEPQSLKSWDKQQPAQLTPLLVRPTQINVCRFCLLQPVLHKCGANSKSTHLWSGFCPACDHHSTSKTPLSNCTILLLFPNLKFYDQGTTVLVFSVSNQSISYLLFQLNIKFHLIQVKVIVKLISL